MAALEIPPEESADEVSPNEATNELAPEVPGRSSACGDSWR